MATTEKVTTYFSNGNRFGLDNDKRIAGFKGINQAGLASSKSFAVLPTVASGGVLAAHVTDAHTHSIRIEDAAGTKYYILCTTTVTNRTGGS